MTLRWQCLCVDASDPRSLGRWWSELLGWRITHDDDLEVVLEPPIASASDGISPDILFLKVPEAKTRKNRLHIDLRPDDHRAEVARAEEMGARRVDIGQAPDTTWVVFADPEGNEFCILRELTSD
jgi:predicted enzyme related to lactoylglutathione lyase